MCCMARSSQKGHLSAKNVFIKIPCLGEMFFQRKQNITPDSCYCTVRHILAKRRTFVADFLFFFFSANLENVKHSGL